MEPTKYHKMSHLLERLNGDTDNRDAKIQTESFNGISKLNPNAINNASEVRNDNQSTNIPSQTKQSKKTK